MDFALRALTEEEEELIDEKINEYAYSVAPPEPGTPEPERLVFRAVDGDGNIAGGCVVNVHAWGRAVLGVLWVDERCRGQGLGSALIREAERAAREKGCYTLCLGTVDFQARGLYEKHGFRVFTVNRDYPRGHESYSLSKRLDRAAPDYGPKNNGAETLYTIEPGGREDAEVISDGLDRYCDQFVKDEHDYIPVGKKLVDGEGGLIAGVAADVDGWNGCCVNGVWVEEAYRGRGLGSRLLREAERAAKESGAYVMQTHACDWNVGFFLKNGYTVRGELEDYPKGHRAYELEKRI